MSVREFIRSNVMHRVHKVDSLHAVKVAQFEACRSRRDLDALKEVATDPVASRAATQLTNLSDLVTRLEQELVEKDGAILELRFERAHAMEHMRRLERRMQELSGEDHDAGRTAAYGRTSLP